MTRRRAQRPRQLGKGIVAALRATALALERAPAPGIVIGGIAVIARGVPRLTRDVDVTIAAADLNVSDLAAHFAQHGFEPRIDDAVSFARRNHVLLLRHVASRVDLDVSLAWLPFEVEAIRKADHLRIGGVSIAVARAEDLIVYKVIAWRPQDQQDAERLLALHGNTLNLPRVRRLIRDFAAALDAPERVAEVERLVEGALSVRRARRGRKTTKRS